MSRAKLNIGRVNKRKGTIAVLSAGVMVLSLVAAAVLLSVQLSGAVAPIGGLAWIDVNQNGLPDDGTNYTGTSAIQDAIDAASDGDIILVDYNNSFSYGGAYVDKSLTIRGVDLSGGNNKPIVSSEVGFSVDASNVYISGFDIQNCLYGVYLRGVTTAENCNISNNDIHGCDCGIYVEDGANYNTIYGNKIYDNHVGIYIEHAEHTSILYNEIFENHDAAPRCGIHLEYTNDTVIEYNQIYNNSDDGIYVYISENVTIQYNDIYNNRGAVPLCGIYVEDSKNIEVHYNNIEDNIYGVTNVVSGSENVDATYNWWGDASGPYHATTNPSATGDEVSDYVDYIPWLDAPYPTGQPRSFNVYIDKNGNGKYDEDEPTYNSIQGAIDNAEDGDIIVVHSGTYKENLQVDVPNVTIINGSTPVIDGQGGIGIDITEPGVTISGFIIYNCSYGIILETSANWTNISNNIIYDCTSDGIWVNGNLGDIIHDNTIYNNIIYNCSDGINVEWANDTIIKKNTIYNCGSDGIELDYCIRTSIIQNEIFDDREGIDLDDCAYTYILSNMIYDCGGSEGIDADDCNYIDVIDNLIYNIDNDGVEFDDCNYINITDNRIYNLSDEAVDIDDCDHTNVIDNWMSDSHDDGMRVDTCNDTKIIGNYILNSINSGIWMSYAENTSILSNIIRNNSPGIELWNSPTTVIRGNRIAENPFDTGIWADHASDGLIIVNNNIVANDIGIRLDNHTKTKIHYNNIWNNSIEGLNNTNMSGFTPLTYYVDATYNWWGASDGPGNRTGLVLDPVNGASASGSGDNVSNNTHFYPFNIGLGNDTEDPYAYLELGKPMVWRDYYGQGEFPAIKACTPLWINATDYNGTGVYYMWADVYVKTDPSGVYEFKYRVEVYDNGVNDSNEHVGEISLEFHMSESCLHEIVFHCYDLAGNEFEDDYIFIVDACPPEIQKYVGEPKLPEGTDADRWVSYETPIYFTANDSCCLPNGTGVERLWYGMYWYNTTVAPYRWEELVNVTVWDQSENDLDERLGFIRTPEFHFTRDCRHEIRWKAWDYVGNEAGGKQEHWVDGTPPAIRKDIEKLVVIEQTLDGKSAAIREVEVCLLYTSPSPRD